MNTESIPFREMDAARVVKIMAGDDAAIVERVVRNALAFVDQRTPRWVGVQRATMHGSTVCRALCQRFGLDPDETKSSRNRNKRRRTMK